MVSVIIVGRVSSVLRTEDFIVRVLAVRIVLDCEVGICWEQKSIPWTTLVLASLVFIVECWKHSLVCNIVFIRLNHGGVWSECWVILIWVWCEGWTVSDSYCNDKTHCHCWSNCIESHLSSGGVSCRNIDEVMNDSLDWHKRYSTPSLFVVLSYHDRDWPGQQRGPEPVFSEVKLIWTLHRPHIFPWNSLGVSSVFTESVSDPWVWFKVLLEPVLVFSFHLWSWNRCRFKLQNFISFSDELLSFLICDAVVSWTTEPLVISTIELGNHFANWWMCFCESSNYLPFLILNKYELIINYNHKLLKEKERIFFSLWNKIYKKKQETKWLIVTLLLRLGNQECALKEATKDGRICSTASLLFHGLTSELDSLWVFPFSELPGKSNEQISKMIRPFYNIFANCMLIILQGNHDHRFIGAWIHGQDASYSVKEFDQFDPLWGLRNLWPYYCSLGEHTKESQFWLDCHVPLRWQLLNGRERWLCSFLGRNLRRTLKYFLRNLCRSAWIINSPRYCTKRSHFHLHAHRYYLR